MAPAPTPLPSSADVHTLLQISDCHLVTAQERLLGVDTQRSLEAVLEQALAEGTPDAILASGDLAHEATETVYRRFLDTVRRFTDAPLLCLPGNHDVLAAMQAAGLPMAPLQLGSWAVVWIDSHEDDKPRAHIDAADRAAFAAELAGLAAEHVLLATHHPFVAVNAPWLDSDRIQGPEELLEWCAERCVESMQGSGRLQAAVFGHAHQEVSDTCAAWPVYGVPSTCFQFQPRSARFAVDTLPPGYRWLELATDGTVHTRVARVASFTIEAKLPSGLG